MLRSMTGFGQSQGVVEGVEFTVEIRSVNHRYFKAAVRLPESFSTIEQEIENLLRSRLRRGSVLLMARMKVPDERAACRVNAAALASYVEQLRPLEIDANPMLRVDLASLLQLPGVCEPVAEELCQRTREGLLRLVKEALDKLVRMRETEGRAVQADLLSNCQVIGESLSLVAERAPRVLQDYHDRLAARVNELTHAGNVKIDEEVLAREVAIFAERSDIAEEINRLKDHVRQFQEAVGSAQPAGRKLDFIAQEMLREANTIASKGSDVEIARAVVEMKTAVDRIKEQVQNVE